jgi:hypothetical protein
MDIAKKMVNEKWTGQPRSSAQLLTIKEHFIKLYKRDSFFASHDFNRFSISKIKDFVTYSQHIVLKFHGNLPTEDGKIEN